MEGRGSLRQLHQQLAGASYAPNPYGAVQDWHASPSSSSGYEKRAPPPLPTLPPWAANPLGNSSHQQQHQYQYSQFPQHHQQQQFAPMSLPSSMSGGGMPRNSYSREEIDPASASSSGYGKDQQRDAANGWRKAPSYFGSMKRLPLNNSIEQGFSQNAPLRQQQQQLPDFPPRARDDEERPPMAPLHKEQLPQEPQSVAPQPQFHHCQCEPAKNQQQEAEEGLGGEPHVPIGASRSSLPIQQQQSSEPEDPAPEAVPSIDQTFNNRKDEATNQAEEENHRHHHFQDEADPLHSATAVVVQQSGFFRPWKKCPPSEDDNNNNSSHSNDLGDESGEYSTNSPQVNKWKVRALLNPFARRGGGGGKLPSAKPFSRFSSAAINSEPNDDEDLASRDDSQQPPPPAIAAAVGAPRRPTTPVPAPSALSLASVRPPSNHRSRGQLFGQDVPASVDNGDDDKLPNAFGGNSSEDRSLTKPNLPPFVRKNTKALNPTQGSPQSLQAPPERENCYNREEREDFQSFKAPPVKQPKPQPPIAREPKPPVQQQQQQQSQQHVTRETKQQHAATAKAKPKGSVLNALAEIQRKRDVRRAQQAEEKQRIQTELEEHGDDAGYKFRRLIQKYRDALPAFQKQEKKSVGAAALPPITQPAAAIRSTAQAAASTARLSVFVRKRPLSKKELKAKGYDIISCLYFVATGQGKAKAAAPAPASSKRQELILHEPKLKVDCSQSLEHHQFRFDGVFDELQDNSQVYACSVGPLIPYLIHDRILETRSGNHSNLTVFAYGQTGSGKTYTMKSIYRQAASDLFERIEACCGGSNDGGSSSPVLVGVSFYEIYMNNVNDLLNGRSRLQLMEDGEGTVQLLGLKEIMISSADELLDLVKHGEDSRATSANAVHDDSSRSHALLRITLYPNTSGNSSTILARLSMVDLAGSERACDTQSDNFRSLYVYLDMEYCSKNTRMEGAEINKSLLALKECVRALDRGAGHIPFRQSKLTQLLRDSFLSESSKTVMIATVSPWSESCNHTLNTLRYADRLKEIGAA